MAGIYAMVQILQDDDTILIYTIYGIRLSIGHVRYTINVKLHRAWSIHFEEDVAAGCAEAPLACLVLISISKVVNSFL